MNDLACIDSNDERENERWLKNTWQHRQTDTRPVYPPHTPRPVACTHPMQPLVQTWLLFILPLLVQKTTHCMSWRAIHPNNKRTRSVRHRRRPFINCPLSDSEMNIAIWTSSLSIQPWTWWKMWHGQRNSRISKWLTVSTTGSFLLIFCLRVRSFGPAIHRYSLIPLRVDVRFMLLHDSKNDDGIKHFFTECHELFIKVCWFVSSHRGSYSKVFRSYWIHFMIYTQASLTSCLTAKSGLWRRSICPE